MCDWIFGNLISRVNVSIQTAFVQEGKLPPHGGGREGSFIVKLGN